MADAQPQHNVELGVSPIQEFRLCNRIAHRFEPARTYLLFVCYADLCFVITADFTHDRIQMDTVLPEKIRHDPGFVSQAGTKGHPYPFIAHPFAEFNDLLEPGPLAIAVGFYGSCGE